MRGSLPSAAEAWELRLREHYNHLFVRIILPMLMVTAAFLLLSHWRWGGVQSVIMAWTLALLTVANAWLIWLNQPPSEGGGGSYADYLRTFKWCLNFLLVGYIAWGLHVHTALTTVWVMLTFGALIEIQRQYLKIVAGVVALSCFCVLLALFYPYALTMWLYLVACYVGLVFTFLKLERYLQDEMIQLFDTQLRCARMEREAQGLQRDAAIGYSVRALTHEISNLIGVAAISAGNLRHSPVAMPKDIDRLEKSLRYMARVSNLVLDGIGSRKVAKHMISLAELRDDVQLLLGDGVGYPNIALRMDFPADAGSYQFEERVGSTYLIIHNLVKNALESVFEVFGGAQGGVVSVSSKVIENKVIISVADNGAGMSEVLVNSAMQGSEWVSNVRGHGLGLDFVQKECKSNGFVFIAPSSVASGVGLQVSVIIVLNQEK